MTIFSSLSWAFCEVKFKDPKSLTEDVFTNNETFGTDDQGSVFRTAYDKTRKKHGDQIQIVPPAHCEVTELEIK